MDGTLSEESVRDFLIKNPEFTEKYFAKHATSEMIQKWFERRSKYNQTESHLGRATKFSLAVQQEVSEDEGSEENIGAGHEKNSELSALRRNSEPITDIKSGEETAFEIRGMRKKKALTQVRDKIAFSKTFEEPGELLSLLYNSKVKLRKTQSAPTCKNIFNKLINSSIYLHSIPTNDNKYKIELRSASEDEFLKELIQDIVQDLNLKTLCHKIIVNIGILTKSAVASLYLFERKEQRKILKVCYKNFVFNDSGQNIKEVKFDGRLQELHEDDIFMKVVDTGKSSIVKQVNLHLLFLFCVTFVGSY